MPFHRRHKLRMARLSLIPLEMRAVPAAVAWDGGAGTGNWSDALNWDTNALPMAGDDVTIATGTTVNFSAAVPSVTLNTLTCSAPFQLTGSTLNVSGASNFTNTFKQTGGTFGGVGAVTFNGAVTTSGGIQTGAGTTSLSAGQSWTIDTTLNAVRLDARAFTNNGSVTWIGNSNIDMGGSGTWTNASGSTFDLQGNGTWQFTVGPAPMPFNINAGAQFTRTVSTGTTLFNGPFNNSGSVTISTGTLQLNSGGTEAGAFSVAATLQISGSTITINSGTALTGAGNVKLTAGTLTVSAPLSFDVSFSQSGGVLNGTGAITFNAAVSMTAGQQTGAGTTVLNAGKTWTIDTTSSAVGLDTRAFTNNGSVTWLGNNNINMGGSGTWTNASGSTFDLQGNGTWQFAVGPAPMPFNINAGAQFIRSVSTGTTQFSGPFNNSGSVTVSTGTLQINAGGIEAGAFNVAGTLQFSSSTVTINSGTTMTGAGNVKLASGTLTVSTPLSFDVSFTQSGGILNGTSTLTFNAAVSSTAGQQTGAGTTVLNAGKTWTIDTTSSAVGLDTRAFTNNGSVTWLGNNNINMGGSGTWTNTSGSTFNVQGNGTWQFTVGPAPMSFNINVGAQFIRSVSTGTTQFSGPFNNSGSVTVSSGKLQLNGGGAETGLFNLTGDLQLSADTVTFNSGTSTTGTGTVSVTAGTLTVPSPFTFNVPFTQSGGTVNGTSTITFNNSVTMTAGTQNGTGATILNAGKTWTIDTTATVVTLQSRTFTNNGTVTWLGNNSINMGDGSWTNKTGSVFDAQGNGTWQFTSGSVATPFNIDAGAQFKKTVGSATTTFGGPFNNSGTATVSTGTLNISSGGAEAGAFSVAGKLQLSGGIMTTNAGTTLTGAGSFLNNGGTLTVSSPLTCDLSYTQSGGVQNGASTLTFNNTVSVTGGQFNGTGGTVLNAGKSWTLDTSITVIGMFTRTFTNNGSVTWIGSNNINNGDGSWTHKSGSTFDVQANAAFAFTAGGTGMSHTFDAGSNFTRTVGGGGVRFDGAFNNNGSVTVSTGILQLSGGGTQTSNYSLTGELRFGSGTNNFNSGSSITGAGPVSVTGGTTNLKTGSSISGLGALTISGGVFDVGINYTQAGAYSQSSGTLQGSGSITFNGGGIVTGGIMSGTGQSAFAAGKAWTINTTTTVYTISVRTFINNGAMTWLGNNNINMGDGSWTNTSGSTFDLQGNGTWAFTSGGTPMPFTIEAGAQFTKSIGTGISAFNGPFNNAGTVTVSSGTLQLNAGGAESGAFGLNGGAMIWASGTVNLNAGTTISGPNTLTLSNATVNVNAAVSIDTPFTQTAGVIQGTSTLTLNNASMWTGGTETGLGTTVLAAGKNLIIDTSANAVAFNVRTFHNFGTVTWKATGGTPQNINTGDGGWFNKSGGVFDLQTNTSWAFTAGSQCTPITNDAGGTLLRSTGTGTVTLQTNVTNNGTIQVDTGTLDLQFGTAKLTNFAGSTLTGGSYVITSSFRFPGANIVTNSASITLNGTLATIRNTTGNTDALANFATNTASGSVTLLNNNVLTVPGPFTTAGNMHIDGTFTVTANGASITAGSVNVISQMLVGGKLTQNGGVTTVAGGLTDAVGYDITGGTLMGTGTVTATVNNSGGSVAPGASPGQLNIVGNYDQSGTGKLSLELNGPTAVSQFDRLNVQGSVTYGGAGIVGTLGFPTQSGDNFVVVTNDFADKSTGTFNGIPENSKTVIGGATFRVNYNAGDGNDLVLTRLATGIESIVLADGSAQRSTIRTITMTFGGLVNFPPTPSNAVQLTRTGPGAPANVTVNVDTSGSTATQTIAKLTFTGAQTEFASLIDGLYTLSVFGGQLTDQGGQFVDADNNGTPGGNNVSMFHRLYGDADGDRNVAANDFIQFRLAFGGTGATFDFDNDGNVSASDFILFRLRFGGSI